MPDPTRSLPPTVAPSAAATREAGEPTTLPDDPGGTARPLPPTDRYQLVGELARGGMGVVYAAHDTVLDRAVAVKVLKQVGSEAAARRFVHEAKIAGQLQHPAIPPVHDLGTLPDGRPFLAMKLIKGRTLEELLTASGGRESPVPSHQQGADPPRSPNLVAVFEQVCQAVGYAHDHAVIHRDLKPSNVMVGGFAEVQVMDWGLAKQVRSAECGARSEDSSDSDPPSTPHSALRTPRSFETQAGSVLGTPAFMPPEQAGGEIDKVDARADVFGLGAILCVILTGKPPYVGATAEAVRLMAVRGQLADCLARLDACAADPELIALCKRCLAFVPAERPRNAGEVADAVAALRAAADERARAAERERAAAREQRKRRRVQFALAAAVGLLLLGGGAFAWWQDAQAAKQQLADEKRKQAEERAALARESSLHSEGQVHLYNAMMLVPNGGLTDPAEVRKAAARVETAVELFEAAVREFPGNDSHRYFLGWACQFLAVVKLVPADRNGVADALALLDRAAELLEPFESDAARARLTTVSRRPVSGLDPQIRNIRLTRLWAYLVAGRPTDALVLFGQLYPRANEAAAVTPFTGEPEVPTHKELEQLILQNAPYRFDGLGAGQLYRFRTLLLRTSEEEQAKILTSGKAADDFPRLLGMAESLAAARGVAGPAVYNAACAFSLASAQPGIAPEERERRAARAVEHLRRLHAGGYFRHPVKAAARRAELEADADFAPLRGRDDFRAALNAVRADADRIAPPPREVTR